MKRNAPPPSKRRIPWWMIAVLGVSAALFAGGMYGDLRSSQRQLDAARADLSECRTMIAEINRLRTRPRVAAVEVEPPSRIAERVSAALQIASISPEKLVRIEPQAPQRIAGTQYQTRPTNVELQRATLEEIVRFAHLLTDVSEGMQVRDLVLLEPRGEATDGEVWTAEITLTQMIFSPTLR